MQCKREGRAVDVRTGEIGHLPPFFIKILVKGSFSVQSYIFRVRAGFRKFWEVPEIYSVIFQDLGSFGIEKFFKMALKKFWVFVWENSQIS